MVGRLAVAATVPTLAIAAHGVASGAVPGLDGIALCLFIGVVAGMCTGRRCGAVALLAVLSAAQFASHLALAATMPMTPGAATPTASMAGMDHHGMDHTGMAHTGMAHSGMSMMLTHLIAIPLCALLIAAAVAVVTVITSVLATLRRPRSQALGHVVAVVVHAGEVRWHRIDRAAGAGERGPPLIA